MYYIITSAKKKKVLATKNIGECFEFIYKHKDAKIRKLDHTAKPRIFDRRDFLTKFLNETKEQEQTFQLAEIMIGGKSNFDAFLNSIGKMAEYILYKKITDKNL
ncbi:MAG: hypothetical protein QM499_01225 [Flavobacteriaceae bacterium]